METQEKIIKYSLRKKTTILIIFLVLLLGTASVLVNARGTQDIIQNRYKTDATNLSRTVASIVDAERLERFANLLLETYEPVEPKITSEEWGSPAFEEYMGHFESLKENEDFLALRDQLRTIQDVNDVDCIYISGVDNARETMFYIVDAAYEDACDPGVIDPLLETNLEVLTNPERGFPPYMSNMESYGWLMSAGSPVHNAKGEVVAYAFVDISMNVIIQQQQRYMFISAGIMAVLAVLSCIAGILIVQKAIIRPLRLLTDASAKYFSESGDLDHSFSEVEIRTGDEIEVLANSMARMEQNVNEHITQLLTTTNELNAAQSRADEMDRQANVDMLTKVRNKRAFSTMLEMLNRDLEEGKTDFGFIMADMNNLKEINDAHGHDKGDLAIQAACALICSVFKHSPVFRIGGDEFVVVLTDEDLKDREKLLRQFRTEAEKGLQMPGLPEWKQVDVAMGLAVFDPRIDKHPEDALHRADETMYTVKREWKAAHPRRYDRGTVKQDAPGEDGQES